MGCTTPGRPAALPRLIRRRDAERFRKIIQESQGKINNKPKKPKARPLPVRTIGLCEKDEKFISKAIELSESNIIPYTLRFLKIVIFLPFNLPKYIRRFMGCLRNYR